MLIIMQRRIHGSVRIRSDTKALNPHKNAVEECPGTNISIGTPRRPNVNNEARLRPDKCHKITTTFEPQSQYPSTFHDSALTRLQARSEDQYITRQVTLASYIHPATQRIFAWFIPHDISGIFAGTVKHSFNEREEVWVTKMLVPETQSGFLGVPRGKREQNRRNITLLKIIDMDSFDGIV